jgi:predicted permease
MRFLETLVPETMGKVRLTLDGRVLAFSAALAVAVALTTGLLPALRGSRISPPDGLREGGRGTTGASRHWLQHSLILVELALAVVLLTSGGLLLQTFQRLANTDLGLRAEKLLTCEMPLFRYADFDRRVAYVNAQLERIRARPGVVDAGAISRIPLTPADHATFYLLPGQTEADIPKQVALIRVVTSGYFSTIGARLREGRFFEASDQRSASPSAIVNESFARRNFSGRSPLGERLKFGQLDEKGYWYTIVGVVERLREVTIAEEPRPAVYLLHEQTDQFGTKGAGPSWIVVRTAGEPSSIVPALREAIRSLDRNQPIWRVQTLEEIVDRQLSTPRQTMALMSAFALLALLLASLGIYGVLSSAVIQRASEIGVRMALGASPGEILLSFGKRGLMLTLAGLAIGLGLAALASRWMSALLYGFRPDYVATVTVVSLVLLAVSAMACLVPARRASRVDPMVALRNE